MDIEPCTMYLAGIIAEGGKDERPRRVHVAYRTS